MQDAARLAIELYVAVELNGFV